MSGMSFERVNPDDWPPIFTVRLESAVTLSEVQAVARGTLAGADVTVMIEAGGPAASDVEGVVAPHVHSVTVLREEPGPHALA